MLSPLKQKLKSFWVSKAWSGHKHPSSLSENSSSQVMSIPRLRWATSKSKFEPSTNHEFAKTHLLQKISFIFPSTPLPSSQRRRQSFIDIDSSCNADIVSVQYLNRSHVWRAHNKKGLMKCAKQPLSVKVSGIVNAMVGHPFVMNIGIRKICTGQIRNTVRAF